MRNLKWWVFVLGAVVLVAAVGAGILLGRSIGPRGSGGDTTQTAEPTSSVEPTTPEAPDDGSAEEPQEPGEPQYVRVYFARGEHIGVALREITPTKAVATAAMQQLLAGPTAQEQAWGLATAIPAGTRLLGVEVDRGTARVDLSGEFDDGGGTLSMTMRLAQVVYTLTQFPTVQRVEFYMNGSRVDVFGGEGIVLTSPKTRADFEEVTPAILVEEPTPGATVRSPLRVRGTANTFEAMFMVSIEDASGTPVIDVPVMATSGTGTRGTFDVSLPFTLTDPGPATLVVYEPSAKDGSPINVVRIPVVLER